MGESEIKKTAREIAADALRKGRERPEVRKPEVHTLPNPSAATDVSAIHFGSANRGKGEWRRGRGAFTAVSRPPASRWGRATACRPLSKTLEAVPSRLRKQVSECTRLTLRVSRNCIHGLRHGENCAHTPAARLHGTRRRGTSGRAHATRRPPRGNSRREADRLHGQLSICNPTFSLFTIY
jgi:hypothetical protein